MTIPSCDIQASDIARRGIEVGGDRRAEGDTAPAELDALPAPRRRRDGTRRMALHFAVVLLGASLLALLIGGPKAALSTALGVTLAGANLLLMRKITSALAEASGGSAAWALALPFKLAALVGVAYALVDLRVAQPVPLAIGFALLPLTGVFLPRASSVPDLYTPSSPGLPGASRPRRDSMK
jgi:hypothetical protein